MQFDECRLESTLRNFKLKYERHQNLFDYLYNFSMGKSDNLKAVIQKLSLDSDLETLTSDAKFLRL